MIEKIEAIRSLVGGAITQKYNGDVIYHDGQVAPTEAEIQARLLNSKQTLMQNSISVTVLMRTRPGKIN